MFFMIWQSDTMIHRIVRIKQLVRITKPTSFQTRFEINKTIFTPNLSKQMNQTCLKGAACVGLTHPTQSGPSPSRSSRAKSQFTAQKNKNKKSWQVRLSRVTQDQAESHRNQLVWGQVRFFIHGPWFTCLTRPTATAIRIYTQKLVLSLSH